jgi:LysR family hydrogen peroxide-inducible transcriptional activator
MNFQQLSYIIAIHQHKHFAKAAESCHVTQATLSAMVKKLEEELELVIFDRSKQPVITTEDGLKVLQLANTIIAQQKALLELKNNDNEPLKGTLKIGIIPTVASTLLPIILPTILAENPQLQLVISEITTEEIIQQLHQDNIDIGLLATPLNNQLMEETILYYEPMMLYGVKTKGKKYVSGKDVKDSKVWLLEEGNCFRSQSISICNIQEKDLEQENLKFEASSFDTLLNLSDKFGGYTLVPELYYNSLPKNKKAQCKPFIKPIPVREISLIHYRPHAKKNAVAQLAKTIQSLVLLSSAKLKAKDLSIIGI